MSLDICVTIQKPVELSIDEHCYESVEVGEFNITHNLTTMALKAGLYTVMWHPTKTVARDFIVPLAVGLVKLLSNPDYYREFNPENGWGTYEYLVEVVSDLLEVCINFPEGEVNTHG